MEPYNPEEWYSSVEATDKLSQNSGRRIDPSYVRWMAKEGRVKARKLGKNFNVYDRKAIDSYIVEPRGIKAGRAMHERKKVSKNEG